MKVVVILMVMMFSFSSFALDGKYRQTAQGAWGCQIGDRIYDCSNENVSCPDKRDGGDCSRTVNGMVQRGKTYTKGSFEQVDSKLDAGGF